MTRDQAVLIMREYFPEPYIIEDFFGHLSGTLKFARSSHTYVFDDDILDRGESNLRHFCKTATQSFEWAKERDRRLSRAEALARALRFA